mmetsp:Transcript_11789/g.15697  ORF Transcript_11789/g.15697 Transcript_11789/m.15697 type:complete len:106 (-) Transcript_11789:555-872(-)
MYINLEQLCDGYALQKKMVAARESNPTAILLSKDNCTYNCVYDDSAPNLLCRPVSLPRKLRNLSGKSILACTSTVLPSSDKESLPLAHFSLAGNASHSSLPFTVL